MFEKICIVTLYDNINIGNKLQNYAAERLCLEFAKEVETLTYFEAYGIAPDMSWKGRLVAKIGFPKGKASQKRAILRRRKKFENFSAFYLHPTPEISFKSLPENLPEQYDAFVVGSDQVWHNWTDTDAELRYFMLEFAPIEKRICISPSFGFNDIPEKYLGHYVNGMKGFRFLSCREKDGCDLIEAVTGRKAELLLDPTLMFDCSDWMEIEKKPNVILPDKYMVVYFLGGIDDITRKDIMELARANGLEPVFVFDLLDLRYFDVSPDEFLYLIRNSSMVCTNSFHGCVFSILYGKRFTVFDRKDSEGIKMMSRLSTLLDIFGIPSELHKMRVISPDIYQSNANRILKREREHMSKYLSNCFSKP